MKYAAILTLLFSIQSFFIPANSQDNVIISEFMAINDSTITDEDGENSDWIEIYNAETTEVSLKGWTLTDDDDNLGKWIFPDIKLLANEYLVIFASGKDRKADKTKLHTNFKLSSSGEYLALIKPLPTRVATQFSRSYPVQFTGVSYGRDTSGYTYLATPTPGNPNISKLFITPPQFSVKHGFFDNSFNLEINTFTKGAEIYYTTNSSTPGKTNGIKYSSPIEISTTTIVRAIAITDGSDLSITVTQSYIFPKDVAKQPENPQGYPTTWLSPIHGSDNYFDIPGNYNMKPEFVNISQVSGVIVQSLKSLPVVSVVSDIDNFFSKSTHPDSGGIYMYNGEPDGLTVDMKYHLGRGWTRPASVEYFNSNLSDGSIDFQSNCSVRIHGGATRTRAKTEKHSFKIGFQSDFGPSKLNVQLFGGNSPEKYDWLILRGGFAPRLGQQIRDPWAKSTLREMGQYAARSKFVHVYINGLYWGMYNLSEQMDENCLSDNLGGNAGYYDILKDYQETEAGDTIAWSKLVSMSSDNISEPANYQKIMGNNPDGSPNPAFEKLLNPESLIDYILMNMYAGTTDWDFHNWFAARSKINSDGFHFLAWDAEGAFQGNNIEMIVMGGYKNRPTGVFSNLLKNQQFKNMFISHVNKHMFEGGALTPDPSIQRYDKWLAEIDTALISDQARWEGNSNDIWNRNYHSFRNNYFRSRNENVFSQMVNKNLYPRIDIPVLNTDKTSITDTSKLTFISPSEGEIRYTIDGSDPGVYKPEQSKSIYIFKEAFTLDSGSVVLSARVKQDTLWSIMFRRTLTVSKTGAKTSIQRQELAGNYNLFNYPNPCKDFTNITFDLKEDAVVSIRIFNSQGILVDAIKQEYKVQGLHSLIWHTGKLPKGFYSCILEDYTHGKTSRIGIIKN